ncbi:MAG: hypothetical protein SGILL_009953 [Bacillariaceae sp.]
MYDVDAWKQALVDSVDTSAGKKAFAASSCKQFDRPHQNTNTSSAVIYRPANVYCFEPITATFRALQKAKMKLGWHNELILEQAAVGGQPGTLYVPGNVQLGDEKMGMNENQANCADSTSNNNNCLQVPVYTLNDYITSLPQQPPAQEFSKNPQEDQRSQPVSSKQIIHFLSIDVEGYDFQVLQGSTNILKDQVQYLEFEYNWKPPWAKSSLQDAIEFLDNYGFTCYWPGSEGELWKISHGCWLDHYHTHYWSNVACVNRLMGGQARELAMLMEKIFLETLGKNDTIRY